MKRIIPLFLLLAFLASCQDVKKGQSDNIVSPTWDSLIYEKEYLYNDSLTDGPKYEISFNILHPVGETSLDASIDSVLTKFLFSKNGVSMETAMHEYSDSLISSFKDEIAEFYDPLDEFSSRYQYSLEMKGSLVQGTKEGIAGYCMEYYTYLGGAHGSYIVLYQNIDASNGRLLRASDVFDLSKTDEILALIVNQLLADNNCANREELIEKTDILMLGEPYISDANFLILEDGVRFLYNQYEIACYAAGTIQTTVPFDKIQEYMIWK